MINLQPYSNPMYFVWLLVSLLPLMIGLYFGKRFVAYQTIISGIFLLLIFGGSKWQQGLALIGYIIFQFIVVDGYVRYKKRANQTWVFVGAVLLSILPLVIVKITPAVQVGRKSLVGFLGISYLTFKSVQVIMETRDGTIKKFDPIMFARFLLFFPTVSSGPIDRYRRFQHDYLKIP
ncbi:MAG: D-alanyl-lipoteichoic acid biosynthesis protein DltB, partial [Loigolactobacillus coryniformis]|nr:D-alanyl-lipoteichoic acid biosynthesis protein DltB [Loigolactobacillus coryniformis]